MFLSLKAAITEKLATKMFLSGAAASITFLCAGIKAGTQKQLNLSTRTIPKTTSLQTPEGTALELYCTTISESPLITEKRVIRLL